jgi:hypothetical protein
MADDLTRVWQRAMDANLRFYQGLGRLAGQYIAELSGMTTEATPAPVPAPALVLEGPAGSEVSSAVLVHNHLAHQVTALLRANMRDPGVDVRVEPETVPLAPGDSAVVRVAGIVPEGSAHGVLSCPELAGTKVPIVVRATG